MKLIVATILAILITIDPGKIGEVNSVKSAARKAYVSGDYKKAIEKYRYLADSLDVTEDEVMLNLANSYFQTNDTAQASNTYKSLIGSPKPAIRSKAQQQLGILNYKQGKLDEALNNFKQSIKADADNIDARYNYEMLKKKLDEQEKKQQNQENKDQQKKDQQNKEQKNEDQQKKDQQEKDQQKKDQEQKDKEQQKKEQQDKEQESKEEKDKNEQAQEQQRKEQQEKENKEKKENAPQLSEKLEQMKISEEKAKMILEAMKNQEIQYLQQNKRKATKSKDRTKPDW